MRSMIHFPIAALTFFLCLGAALPIVAEEENENPRHLKRERGERRHKDKRGKKPSCGKHDFKALKVELTEEQRRLVEAFKERLNEETRGFNQVVLRGILGEIEFVLGHARRERPDRDNNPSGRRRGPRGERGEQDTRPDRRPQENDSPDIARLKELAEKMRARIRWAHEELRDYRISLHSPAQKEQHYRFLAAKEDHKKNCPHPPRPRPEKRLRLADVQDYKQYGVFDCPPFGKGGKKRSDSKRP